MSTPIDYHTRAQLHRPRDEASLRREALNLLARDLTHRDVSILLQLSESALHQLINDQPGAAGRSTP